MSAALASAGTKQVETMILCIAEVLTPSELDMLRSELESAEFVDGKATAGWHARLVKQNSQLPKTSPALEKTRQIISAALSRNPLFQMATRPKIIRPVTVSQCEAGMSYGTHTDNAIMTQPQMRADISMTLFLSDPETYVGGELVIESKQSDQSFKLAAGALVLYPASSLHRVEVVTAGIRLAAVTWIQSLVRDPGEREILFDLDTARQISFEQHGKTAAFDLISQSHANLLRKWVEL